MVPTITMVLRACVILFVDYLQINRMFGDGPTWGVCCGLTILFLGQIFEQAHFETLVQINPNLKMGLSGTLALENACTNFGASLNLEICGKTGPRFHHDANSIYFAIICGQSSIHIK